MGTTLDGGRSTERHPLFLGVTTTRRIKIVPYVIQERGHDGLSGHNSNSEIKLIGLLARMDLTEDNDQISTLYGLYQREDDNSPTRVL